MLRAAATARREEEEEEEDEHAATDAQSTQCAPVQRRYHTFMWRGSGARRHAPFRDGNDDGDEEAPAAGRAINYRTAGPSTSAQRVLLIHGFGASCNHWRKNIDALAAAGHRVYAIDLLGFGASDKPDLGVGAYGLELWRDLCVDFMRGMDAANDDDNGGGVTVHSGASDVGETAPRARWYLCGNSIGSLVALMTAVAQQRARGDAHRIGGVVLLNCAGGVTGFRYSELSPFGRALWWLFTNICFRPPVGNALFRRLRQPRTLHATLRRVYADHAQVTDELVEIVRAPAHDDGALAVFLAVLRADAGPTPRELLQQLRSDTDVLVMWGADDPWTPLSGGLHPGVAFPQWGTRDGQVRLEVLDACGHCPHDDASARVNAHMVQFIAQQRR